MPAQEFAHRLLISLARQIREGKDLDREKIVEWVLTDSLDKNDSQYDFWKTRIKKKDLTIYLPKKMKKLYW